MAAKVAKGLKRSLSVEDLPEAKVPRTDQETQRSAFLREALQKIELLQSIIAQEDESEDSSEGESEEEIDESADAESLGFAMCARETIQFLIGQGFAVDSDLIVALKERLVGRMSGLPF
ncbi:uncharacterized protein LOC132266014 [Phlebotomus argentipes]|uniref:uncharacterized protein LOC132266014 n=1 Tax=Phlebotomus argentipes TaxID=94469 RepID=UPI0028936840|nr:uncharacterized protein LOC132266014 [Phlebotomus argentipes]